MFIFDSQSEFFRYPQGGISTNQEVEIKIYVKKSFLQRPVIQIEKRSDYSSRFYKEVPTEWVGTEKSYDLYKGIFTIKDSGKYYYKFILAESIHSQLHELLIYE